MTNQHPFNGMKYFGKICLCALSTVVGIMVAGLLSSALHLEPPKLPGPVNNQLLGLLCLVGGLVLSLALAALSPQLPGRRRSRFMIIGWFVFAWLGINNTIEATIFTTLGGGPVMVVTMLFVSIFVAGAVVWLFDSHMAATLCSNSFHRFFDNRTVAQWAVRLLLVVVAFPVIYFFFGMPVGLMVGRFYQNQSFDLRMPSLGVVIGVQFLRGLIALLATLPILVVWPASRQRFEWTFGLNLFVVAGLYGLIQAYWMPWTLRSVHLVELFLDSVAYGWLLAILLLPRVPAPVEVVGARNYNI
jgi:hypothetical protein